jgi:hypothetical protein
MALRFANNKLEIISLEKNRQYNHIAQVSTLSISPQGRVSCLLKPLFGINTIGYL